MKKYFILSLFMIVTSGFLFANKPAQKSGKEIHQLILVKFKDNISPKQINSIDSLAQVLKKKSRTVQKLNWGKRLENSGASNVYDYCLTIKFKNAINFEIFQQNPLRLEFMGKLIPLSAKILKFTYRDNN